MSKLITYDEVLKLCKAMPPRHPRGDPRNNERRSLGAKFGAALKRYRQEHGHTWFEDRPCRNSPS